MNSLVSIAKNSERLFESTLEKGMSYEIFS